MQLLGAPASMYSDSHWARFIPPLFLSSFLFFYCLCVKLCVFTHRFLFNDDNPLVFIPRAPTPWPPLWRVFDLSSVVTPPTWRLGLQTSPARTQVHGGARTFGSFWNCGRKTHRTRTAGGGVCVWMTDMQHILVGKRRGSPNPSTTLRLCVFALHADRHMSHTFILASVWLLIEDVCQRVSDCVSLVSRLPAVRDGGLQFLPKHGSACVGVHGTPPCDRQHDLSRLDAFKISRGVQRAIGSLMITTPNGAEVHYTMSYAAVRVLIGISRDLMVIERRRMKHENMSCCFDLATTSPTHTHTMQHTPNLCACDDTRDVGHVGSRHGAHINTVL